MAERNLRHRLLEKERAAGYALGASSSQCQAQKERQGTCVYSGMAKRNGIMLNILNVYQQVKETTSPFQYI